MTERRLRAGIYCRASHDPSGRGLSVEDQEAEDRRFCAQQNWDVAWVILDNDISAGRHAKRERPGYADVRKRLAGGDPVDVLVLWEASRAQRDLAVYVQVRDLCARHGVLWSYSGRVFDLNRTDDRFSTGLDALLAERSSDETRDRVLRSVRSRLDKGKPHGRMPYGYRAVHDPVTGAPVGRVPDEQTAPIIVEVVRRLLAGEAGYAIAGDLNSRGWAAPSPSEVRMARKGLHGPGRAWTPNQVCELVRNPVYAGLRTSRGAVVGEGTWEPIISASDHAALLEVLNAPERRSTSKNPAPKYLLSGIARCGVCGSPCRRLLNRGYASYICVGPQRRGAACVARRQELVDLLVTERILWGLEQSGALELLAAHDGDDEAAEAARELAELQTRLDGFVDAATEGGLSPTALARIEAKLTPQIEDARRRSKLSARLPTVVGELAGPHARKRWETLSIPQRRQVVRALVTVTIHKSPHKGGSHGFDPSLIKITWR